MLDEKLMMYADAFRENFPLMLFKGTPDAELIKMIDDCLRAGKPLKPKIDPEKLY